MRIIYVHHAERKYDGKWLDDITSRGEEEANLLGESLSRLNVKAIYTSPYLRCKKTALIINKHLNTSIIEDERFNEWNNEEYTYFLNRNMKGIDDIVNSYSNDDIVICVTSGVNLSAFVCYFYGIKPSNDTPKCQAINCSPVNFVINSKLD